MRKHALLVTVVIALLVVPVGCAETSVPQEESGTQEPEGIVLGPEDAFDIAVGWLQEQYPDSAPEAGTPWSSEEVPVVGPSGEPLVGAAKMRIYSDEWEGMVHWAVVAPQYLQYVIVLKSPTLGWRCMVSVTGLGGEITVEEPLSQVSIESSEMLAGTFVMNSPTFIFDGIPDTLELTDTAQGRCPYCWEFTFEFNSAHTGYGDRTDQMVGEAITPHVAVITVESGDVTSAILDGAWDMLKQQML
jgi:hypothetical protein